MCEYSYVCICTYMVCARDVYLSVHGVCVCTDIYVHSVHSFLHTITVHTVPAPLEDDRPYVGSLAGVAVTQSGQAWPWSPWNISTRAPQGLHTS